MGQTLIVRGRIARRLREEAEKLGVTVEEYLVELSARASIPGIGQWSTSR